MHPLSVVGETTVGNTIGDGFCAMAMVLTILPLHVVGSATELEDTSTIPFAVLERPSYVSPLGHLAAARP